jgi:hypothetical protein
VAGVEEGEEMKNPERSSREDLTWTFDVQKNSIHSPTSSEVEKKTLVLEQSSKSALCRPVLELTLFRLRFQKRKSVTVTWRCAAHRKFKLLSASAIGWREEYGRSKNRRMFPRSPGVISWISSRLAADLSFTP